MSRLWFNQKTVSLLFLKNYFHRSMTVKRIRLLSKKKKKKEIKESMLLDGRNCLFKKYIYSSDLD